MALQPNPRTKQKVDALIENFSRIFDEWHLDNGSRGYPKTLKECLYKDVSALLIALAVMDNKAQHLETRIMAEILAFLKDVSAATPYEFVVDGVDKELARQIPSGSGTGEFQVPDLLTSHIINEWVKGAETRKPKAKAALESLLQVINTIIVSDGNVTPQEIAVFDKVSRKFEI